MKAQAICNNLNSRRRFFLLMIAPLLIGLMITLTSSARANWAEDDVLLKNSPEQQGWKPIKIYKISPEKSPPKKKIEKKSWWPQF